MHIDHAQPDANDVGWFVARQPAIVRHLERRCGTTDAFPVALEAAFQICQALEETLGVPPPMVPGSLLERADDAADMETIVPGGARGGCAERQPELVAWVADLLANPPIPLRADELQQVGACLSAVIYALDELTTGRPVP
jgi:hypothetical protein